MPIVLDAMGSDDHPIPEIAAVIEFAKTTGEKVYFVGNKDVIFKHAAESDFAGLPIEIVRKMFWKWVIRLSKAPKPNRTIPWPSG